MYRPSNTTKTSQQSLAPVTRIRGGQPSLKTVFNWACGLKTVRMARRPMTAPAPTPSLLARRQLRRNQDDCGRRRWWHEKCSGCRIYVRLARLQHLWYWLGKSQAGSISSFRIRRSKPNEYHGPSGSHWRGLFFARRSFSEGGYAWLCRGLTSAATPPPAFRSPPLQYLGQYR